tara:strand:+ start:681 stop:1601 length:921 start_codon:yes stop_codon:yes gene_type:complete
VEKVGAYTERATAEGEWRPGNPGTGQQATPMLSTWFNMLQRELINVVESAGIALDTADDAQLLEALSRLTARKVTTITAEDSPKALTVAEAGLVLIDATNGAVSVTLPSTLSNPGVSYRIARTDSANSNAVTINPYELDTIESEESLSIVVGDTRNLESDGKLDGDWKRTMTPLASTAQAADKQNGSHALTPASLIAGVLGMGSTSPNGHVIIPFRGATGELDKLIIQWGAIQVTSGSAGQAGVATGSFPIAFTESVDFIFGYHNTVDSNYLNSQAISLSLETYEAALISGVSSLTRNVRWIAIGK